MAQVIEFKTFERRREYAQLKRDLAAMRAKAPRANSKAAKAVKAGQAAYAVRVAAMLSL